MQDLQHVFQEVDKDKSGWIDEKELYNLFKQLNVAMADPVEDVRSIFMIMDEQKLGRISCDAFCAVFEVRFEFCLTARRMLPTRTHNAVTRARVCWYGQEDIQERATLATNGSVDLDVVIKERLNQYLAETRAQRSLIIRAFMAASRRLDQEGKVSLNRESEKMHSSCPFMLTTVTDFTALGYDLPIKKSMRPYIYVLFGQGFGKGFWGNRWKHLLFDHFFTRGRNTGWPIHVAPLLVNLANPN